MILNDKSKSMDHIEPSLFNRSRPPQHIHTKYVLLPKRTTTSFLFSVQCELNAS